jgi:hypothetical protein
LRKEIAAATPNIHTLYYVGTSWYKVVDITSQSGQYKNPSDATIT